jgi:imidazolonepropionase-like amidohydrolase
MTRPFRIALLATTLFSSAVGARLQPAPAVVAFTHVAVVDPAGTATERDRAVVVTADRIAQIGRTGEVSIPPAARVIDATGKARVALRRLIDQPGTDHGTAPRSEDRWSALI